MLKPAVQEPKISIGEARQIVRDLFEPNPRIYWTDFLLSCAVGAVSSLIVLFLQVPWPVAVCLYVVSVLAYYRAALFTHELTHFRRASFKNFRIVWNLLLGLPFCMPSFLYHIHVSHHARRHYGTDEDGEYIPFIHLPARYILYYVGHSFLIPAAAILRFAVITPITWFSPRFRDWVAQRTSSMVIDYRFVRPLPTVEERKLWRLQEIGCFLELIGAGVLIATGILPWYFAPYAYSVAVCIITLNSIRTLAAHRYLLKGDEGVTFAEQLVDTVNVPRPALLGGLWAPVGLRFHALHHLFPSMPYHNLAEAHRRLMVELPEDSPYRQTNYPSLRNVLGRLWRNTMATSGF